MYATLQDVRDKLPYVPLDASSQPASGVVERWIVDVENSNITPTLAAMGYKTPITEPTSVTWIRDVVSNIVAARVLRAMPQPPKDPKEFQDLADRELKRLTDPKDPFELAAEMVNTGERVIKDSPTRVSSNLKELAQRTTVPFATRDMKF